MPAFLTLVESGVKASRRGMVMIGFHYEHGLMKIMFICHYPLGVSLKMLLECYKHLLVLLAKENQYSKGI